MQAMATMAKRIRLSVFAKILTSGPGPRPNKIPLNSAARKHAVPVAVSQLKSNFAFSGVGLATTGCPRKTALCRYGTFHPPFTNSGVVALPIAVLMEGKPQHNTRADRIAKGIHAFAICAAE